MEEVKQTHALFARTVQRGSAGFSGVQRGSAGSADVLFAFIVLVLVLVLAVFGSGCTRLVCCFLAQQPVFLGVTVKDRVRGRLR
jgi:uncharacterized membrane protein YtjA (UPF0391 family)